MYVYAIPAMCTSSPWVGTPPLVPFLCLLSAAIANQLFPPVIYHLTQNHLKQNQCLALHHLMLKWRY